MFDKQTFKNLEKLSKIKIPKEKEDKFFNEFLEILNYFKEIESLKTEEIKEFFDLESENILRSDDEREKDYFERNKLIKNFSEEKDGYLKVPYIFE